MGVMPKNLAAWIRQLMISAEFSPGIDPQTGAIGLRLDLSEEVPEHVFLKLRFELLIPIVNLDEVDVAEGDEETMRRLRLKKRLEIIAADQQHTRIAFAVDDVLSEPGSKPSYVLRLAPVARDPHETEDAALMNDNRKALESLVDEMRATAHPHRKDGARLEWRNGFYRVRFHHVKHRELGDRANFPNPRYVAVVANRLRGLMARLPTDEGATADPESDARELDALLVAADDAFSDPEFAVPRPTGRSRSESFGYDIYLVHGPEFAEEFDLDTAHVVSLKDREVA